LFEGFLIEMKDFKDEMKDFKDEMRDFKDKSEKDREALHREMKNFNDAMERYRKEAEEENRRKNKEWSSLAKKMGTIVEDLIAPALRPVLSKYFSCEVEMEGQRMFKRKGGVDYEVDAIAACDNMVFMIEARSTPKVDDVNEFVEKKQRFFEFFPEYGSKELIVIFGSITFADNVISYASKKGIYIMAYREWDYMDILNFDEVNRYKL